MFSNYYDKHCKCARISFDDLCARTCWRYGCSWFDTEHSVLQEFDPTRPQTITASVHTHFCLGRSFRVSFEILSFSFHFQISMSVRVILVKMAARVSTTTTTMSVCASTNSLAKTAVSVSMIKGPSKYLLKEYYEIVDEAHPLSGFFPTHADFFTEMHI